MNNSKPSLEICVFYPPYLSTEQMVISIGQHSLLDGAVLNRVHYLTEHKMLIYPTAGERQHTYDISPNSTLSSLLYSSSVSSKV